MVNPPAEPEEPPQITNMNSELAKMHVSLPQVKQLLMHRHGDKSLLLKDIADCFVDNKKNVPYVAKSDQKENKA